MFLFAVIIKLLAFLSSVAMFLAPRSYKAGLMMVSYLLFSQVFWGGLSAMSLSCLCFYASEIRHFRVWLALLKKRAPLRFYLSTGFLLMLLTALCSPHLHNVKELAYYIVGEGIGKFSMLFIGFLTLSKQRCLRESYKVFFLAMMIVFVFALFNIVFKHSIYIDALHGTDTAMYDFKSVSRFRTQATFLNPFDYGFACVVFLLYSGYLFFRKGINVTVFALAAINSVLGIVTCGCRTVFTIFLVVSCISLIMIQKDSRSRWLVTGLILIILTSSYVALPPVRTMINSSLSMFEKETTVEGSSVEGRSMQFMAVMAEIKDGFVFGNGYEYFTKDIGWSENGTMGSDNVELLGLEGVYLNYLLERGVVGFFLYLVMIGAVLRMALCRHCGRALRTFGIAVFLSYIMFAFMTGELLSYQPSMLLIGGVYALSVQKVKKSCVSR